MGENVRSRIIVCGGRHYEDYEQLKRIVDRAISELNLDLTEVEIVSGHCAGADQLGERYAKEHGAKCSIFPAQWHLYGRSAGPIRNSQMVEYAEGSEIPIVVAFLSPRTRGTRDTVKKAEKRGFKVITVEYGQSVNGLEEQPFGKIRSIVIVDDVRKFPSKEMLIVSEPGVFDDYDSCFEDDSVNLDFNYNFSGHEVDVDKLLKVIKSCNTVIGPTIRSDYSENNYAAKRGLPMQPNDYLAILKDLKPEDFKGTFKSANMKRPGDVLFEFIHNPMGYKLKACDITVNDDIDIYIALIPNDYGRYDVGIVSFHDVSDRGEQV